MQDISQEEMLFLLDKIIFEGESIIHGALRLRNYDILSQVLNYLLKNYIPEHLINMPSLLNLRPLRLAYNIRDNSLITLLIKFGAAAMSDSPSVYELGQTNKELKYFLRYNIF